MPEINAEKILDLLVRLWADQHGVKVTEVKITKRENEK